MKPQAVTALHEMRPFLKAAIDWAHEHFTREYGSRRLAVLDARLVYEADTVGRAERKIARVVYSRMRRNPRNQAETRRYYAFLNACLVTFERATR